MLDEIDSFELAEWEAYDRIEPIDASHRFELAAGIVAQTIANANRDPNKTDPFKAKDFMVDWGAEFRDAEVEEALAAKVVENQVNGAVEALGLTWG